MGLERKTRPINAKEAKELAKLKTDIEVRIKNKTPKPGHYTKVIILAICTALLAVLTRGSALNFLFATTSVFAVSYCIFTPFELKKIIKRSAGTLISLDNLLTVGKINVFMVNALRIAKAVEFDDEGDLFIIEYEVGEILYFWNYKYERPKNFPCLEFEIFDEDYSKLTGVTVNSLSEKIKPIIIYGNTAVRLLIDVIATSD